MGGFHCEFGERIKEFIKTSMMMMKRIRTEKKSHDHDDEIRTEMELLQITLERTSLFKSRIGIIFILQGLNSFYDDVDDGLNSFYDDVDDAWGSDKENHVIRTTTPPTPALILSFSLLALSPRTPSIMRNQESKELISHLIISLFTRYSSSFFSFSDILILLSNYQMANAFHHQDKTLKFSSIGKEENHHQSSQKKKKKERAQDTRYKQEYKKSMNSSLHSLIYSWLFKSGSRDWKREWMLFLHSYKTDSLPERLLSRLGSRLKTSISIWMSFYHEFSHKQQEEEEGREDNEVFYDDLLEWREKRDCFEGTISSTVEKSIDLCWMLVHAQVPLSPSLSLSILSALPSLLHSMNDFDSRLELIDILVGLTHPQPLRLGEWMKEKMKELKWISSINQNDLDQKNDDERSSKKRNQSQEEMILLEFTLVGVLSRMEPCLYHSLLSTTTTHHHHFLLSILNKNLDKVQELCSSGMRHISI
jgi:hypothetical protein